MIDGLVYVLMFCQFQVTLERSPICTDGGTPYVYDTQREMLSHYNILSPDQKGNASMFEVKRLVTLPDGSLTYFDNQAPEQVFGLTAVGETSTTVKVSWVKASDNVGVQGYTVYRDGNPLKFIKETSLLDEGLAPSTTYLYTVQAHDWFQGGPTGNGVFVTTPREIRDTTPPTVSISTPSRNQEVSGTVMIVANATDASGIEKVLFHVEGMALHWDIKEPFTFNWDTTMFEDGPVTLNAEAVDMNGNSRMSTNVTVNVKNQLEQ